MTTLAMRFRVFASLLIVINIVGIVWIRESMMALRKPLLRVLSVTPDAALDDADRISLTFHEPIVRPEELAKLIDRSPFELSPNPGGHWEWAQVDRLDFVPEAKLPKGRKFFIRPVADVERRTGRSVYGQADYELRTAALKFVGCKVQSVERDSAVTLELTFNQPVSPAELTVHLAARAEKQALALKVLGDAPAERLLVRIEGAVEQFEFEISPELKGAGAELGLTKKVLQTVKVPSLTRLAVLRADVSTSTFNPESTIAISMSLPLDPRQPAPTVGLEPPVAGARVTVAHDRIVLEGEFVCGTGYIATLPATLVSKDGKTLGSDQRVEFQIEDRDPGVRVPFSSGILSPKGNLILDAEFVNVASVKMSLSRVHRNNLMAHLRGGRSQDTSRDLGSRVVATKGPRNSVVKAGLDLNSILDHRRGIFAISLESSESRWTHDSAIVSITDLAISCKKARDGVVVWVTSVESGMPVPAAKVSAWSRSNQVLAEGVTDHDGLIHLAITPGHPDGALWAITAEIGADSPDSDLSFLKLGGASDLIDEVEQSGREVPTTYDIYIYAERGAYRPGETVHLTGIVRDPNGATPTAFPIAVTVLRPDGRSVADLTATPNAEGVFHADYESNPAGHTGLYQIQAHLPGAAEILGATSALIDDIVPARIEIDAKADKDRYAAGDAPKIHVAARYLFGQAASGLAATLSVKHTPARFEPLTESFKGYSFDIPVSKGDSKPITEYPEATLDSEGAASIRLSVPEAHGFWSTSIIASVAQPGGRTVSATTQTTIDTLARHVGLKLASSPSVKAPVEAHYVILNPDTSISVPAPVTFRLVRLESEWYLEEVRGRPTWRHNSREFVQREWTEPAGNVARGTTNLNFKQAGEYRLAAAAGDARAELEFDVADDEGGDSSNVRPERIGIKLDASTYEPGQTAKATVLSPFAGTMLVSLEADHTLWTKVLLVQATPTVVEVPISATLRGGAYVGVSVVRPLDLHASKWIPARARGLSRLVTTHPAQQLQMAVSAPAQSLPGQKVSVKVQTEVHSGSLQVWAVDDGILLTTAYKKPDPFGHFMGMRRLCVESEDSYRELLPDYQRPSDFTRIGGDGGDDEVVSGPSPRRMKLAGVLWRGVMPIDASGLTSVDFVMPEMTGRMRVFAVAVSGDKYASAEQTVLLASPLMIEASLPRFMAPGDQAAVPVQLINATDEKLAVSLTTSVSGAAHVEQPDQNAVVESHSSMIVWQQFVADKAGDITVVHRVEAASQAGTLTAGASAELMCRAAYGVDTDVLVTELREGTPLDLAIGDKFNADSTSVRLSISPSPNIHLEPALDALIDYPHGCVEQTTSRLYALLEASNTLAATNPDRAAVVDELIKSGIARLWAMQTSGGGFAYWPGSQVPDVWGTANAAEFLVRAGESGKPVEARFLAAVADYLVGTLGARSREEIDDNLRAQICDVLARLDRPQPGWVATLRERASGLDIGGHAHLASALHSAGRADQAMAILKDNLLAMTVATTSQGRLTSNIAQQAELLYVLMQIDRSHAWIPLLATKLNDACVRGQWGSTVENAAAFCALSRYARLSSPPSPYSGVFKQASGDVSFDSSRAFTAQLAAAQLPATLIVRGGNAHVIAVTRGRTKTPPGSVDHGLVVRRSWYDAAGKPIDPEHIRVGDLIECRVSVEAPGTKEAIHNIAVIDLLPAGFEVENPALAQSATNSKERTFADRAEFRDDRAVMFTDAGSKARTYTYFVRAIAAGTFSQPPIQATCMYDASLISVGGESQVIQISK